VDDLSAFIDSRCERHKLLGILQQPCSSRWLSCLRASNGQQEDHGMGQAPERCRNSQAAGISARGHSPCYVRPPSCPWWHEIMCVAACHH
jgi:hypothetical protein